MDEKQRQNLVEDLENEIWQIFQEIKEPNTILWKHTTSWLEMNEDDMEQIKLEGFEELTQKKIDKIQNFVRILDDIAVFTEEEIYRIEDKYEEFLIKKYKK